LSLRLKLDISMKLSASYSSIFLTYFNLTLLRHVVKGEVCEFKEALPINPEDFHQPDWETIFQAAFPLWAVPANGCPRLDKIGGVLEEGYDTFPTPEEGKFNPCYFTKAFDGLDPALGGHPTAIDTKYPYEFAAPFFKQPGDGSPHHCPMNAAADTKIQTCHRITPPCGPGQVMCQKVTDQFGTGMLPPWVPLAAVKNAFLDCEEDVCDWFDDETQPCNIHESVLGRLVYDTFGVNGTIQFTPPEILDDLPPHFKNSTYFKLQYSGNPHAVENHLSPHYCSKAATEEDIWGDFCPYIHTGDNSGLYRHSHLVLAAFELWIANKCKPEKCPSTWLDSPNGKDYAIDKMTSTSMTWIEMDDNENPIAQPAVPYKWPNSGDGLYPGHELYGDLMIKPVAGTYVTSFVARGSNAAASGGIRRNTYMVTVGGLAFAIIVGTYRRFTCEKRSKKQSLDLDSTYILDDSADSYQMSEL